jgi:L-fuconolactonase
VACKLSGLVTEAGTGWTMAAIQPYVDHLLAHFGSRRLLFGSDWPVCTLVASHADVAALARTMLAPQLDDEALDGVFRTNAIAQYGLRVRDE